MTIQKSQIETALSATLPKEIILAMLDEYQHIKQQFFFRKFRPSELNAARFGECVVRLMEFLDTGHYTPFGQSLKTENIINRIQNNTVFVF